MLSEMLCLLCLQPNGSRSRQLGRANSRNAQIGRVSFQRTSPSPSALALGVPAVPYTHLHCVRQCALGQCHTSPRSAASARVIPVIFRDALLGGFSLLCSITEENRAISKAALLQKLELQSNVVRQGWFAASHHDR